MGQLIDQAGVYQIDMGPNQDKMIAVIWDGRIGKYAAFREDGKFIQAFDRDDMIWAKNTGIMHFVEDVDKTIQDLEEEHNDKQAAERKRKNH